MDVELEVEVDVELEVDVDVLTSGAKRMLMSLTLGQQEKVRRSKEYDSGAYVVSVTKEAPRSDRMLQKRASDAVTM